MALHRQLSIGRSTSPNFSILYSALSRQLPSKISFSALFSYRDFYFSAEYWCNLGELHLWCRYKENLCFIFTAVLFVRNRFFLVKYTNQNLPLIKLFCGTTRLVPYYHLTSFKSIFCCIAASWTSFYTLTIKALFISTRVHESVCSRFTYLRVLGAF